MKTAESQPQTTTSDQDASQRETASGPNSGPDGTRSEPIVSRLPDGHAPVDFAAARETETELWQHTLETRYEIRQGNRPDLFVVVPPTEPDDTPTAHNCSLSRSPDAAHGEAQHTNGQQWTAGHGWCSCLMFQSEGICAHLIAIRQQAALRSLNIPEYQPD